MSSSSRPAEASDSGSRSLRIGFDGRDLLRRRTGVTGYAASLAQQLSQVGRADFRVYADTFADPLVVPPSEVRVRRLHGPPLVWKHLALPAALVRDGVRLFHSPTGTLPLWTSGKRVVTIHDLFADVHPEWFSHHVALTLQRAQRRAARTADAIIAVSETTRADLVERYGVEPCRVHVVHNGVDHERFRPPSSDADLDAVAHRFGVRRPFVLCVGSLMPWRNAARLLEAVAALRRDRAIQCDLLFVGRDIWGTDPTRALACANHWDAWARFAGYVLDADLPHLYAAASVLACPSLYEGFGIPSVEAMACGTPVVASTGGALPEVVGDAALTVDPRDVAAIADGLNRALSDDRLAAEMRRRGLIRAARYTWPRAAAATWQVYERALAL